MDTENTEWKRYAADFSNMTDAEIEQESEASRTALWEAEDWLEAVASWEAAGKPRTTPATVDGEGAK